MKYQKVILGFKNSAQEGLELLFGSYGKQLYGFSIAHFSLDKDESYDVLYKTMENVGKVITRYEFSTERHFANWLFKIHKNNILQLLRKKKNSDAILEQVSFEDWEKEINEIQVERFNQIAYESEVEEIDQTDPYEDSMESNKLMLAMEKAMQKLSVFERDLLLLKMSNFSYKEIAKILKTEEDNLKVKFFRAKKKLELKTLDILKKRE